MPSKKPKGKAYFDEAYSDRVIGHAGPMRLIESWANAIAPYLTNCESVLDLGCGLGRLADRLKTGVKYVGVDLSQEAIKYARQNTKRKAAKFTCADLIDHVKGEPEKGYCAVVLSVVLQHLADPAPVIAEAKRVTSYQVIVVVPQGAPNESHVKPEWSRADLLDLMGPVSIETSPNGFYLAIWRRPDAAISEVKQATKAPAKKPAKKGAEAADPGEPVGPQQEE